MNRTNFSKSVFASAGTLIFVFALVANGFAQASDAKIVETKKIVAEIDRVVELTDRSAEYSSIFVAELNVNRKENPYPAVGTYSSTVKFYYTYGDREKNPYPDRLMKIAVEARRSSAVEKTEIFFNNARDMVLYVKTDGESVSSLFFSAGRFIRFERDEKVVPPGDRETPAFLKAVIANKIRLTKIFQAALD